jgi:hypothetical protein
MIRQATGSFAWAMVMLGGFLALSGVIVLAISRFIDRTHAAAEAAAAK